MSHMSQQRTRDPQYPGIYAITNTVNGKQYIGQSQNIAHRWWEHRKLLRRGTCHSQRLQNAWNKYGEAAFTFTVLESVVDLALLDDRERYWVTTLQPAYTTRCDPVTNRGIKHTPESIARMVTGGRARPRIISKETRARISAASTGRIVSPETRAKIRRANLRSMADPVVREKIAASKRGKPRPPEVREALRRANLGKKASEATLTKLRGRIPTPEARERNRQSQIRRFADPDERAKLSAAQMGRVIAAETRAKISAANRGHVMTEEHRANMRAGRKRARAERERACVT